MFEEPRHTLKTKINAQENLDDKFKVVERYAGLVDEKELMACLLETLKMSETIGTGNNADVLDIHGFDSLCVKRMKKIPAVVINTVDDEAAFQQEAFQLGIATPRYLKKIKDLETGQDYVVMEKIDGYAIGDILEDMDNEKYQDILQQYNHESFMKTLHEQIKTLHGHNIYHRDLHTGNVMVTRSGQPVLIDWGAASKEYLTDSDERYLAYGKRWISSHNKYEWGTGRVLDDEEHVGLLGQALMKFKKHGKPESTTV